MLNFRENILLICKGRFVKNCTFKLVVMHSTTIQLSCASFHIGAIFLQFLKLFSFFPGIHLLWPHHMYKPHYGNLT